MSRFRPSVLRSPQRAVERPYHDPIGQAMSYREPARHEVHVHPQDPHATATAVGAGDRAIAAAQRRLLNPFAIGEPAKPAELAPVNFRTAFRPPAVPRTAAPAVTPSAAPAVRPGFVPITYTQDPAYRAKHPDWFEPSTPESG